MFQRRRVSKSRNKGGNLHPPAPSKSDPRLLGASHLPHAPLGCLSFRSSANNFVASCYASPVPPFRAGSPFVPRTRLQRAHDNLFFTRDIHRVVYAITFSSKSPSFPSHLENGCVLRVSRETSDTSALAGMTNSIILLTRNVNKRSAIVLEIISNAKMQ